MNTVNKLPWQTGMACSALVGLIALRAVCVFHPDAPALACLSLWGGPHLGPLAGFVFSKAPSVTDILLGALAAGCIVLPLGVARRWARLLGSVALVFWFVIGLVYVYSGV